jgi:hypothetical protein
MSIGVIVSKKDKLKDVIHNVFGTVVIVGLIKSKRMLWIERT